jgi:hypothetical protein
MRPVPGQVSIGIRRAELSTNLRRLKMVLTKDDINTIMDLIPEGHKAITIDKDEQTGDTILDIGDFLTIFANAVLDYETASKFKSMKEDVQ